MSRIPRITADGRGLQLAGLVALALGQAVAGGATALGVSAAFGALRAPAGDLPVAALAVIAGSALLLAGFRAAEAVLAEHVGQKYAAAVRERLFLHISRMPVGAMRGKRNGALSLRFVGDLTAIKSWISGGIARLVSAAVTIPAMLLVLYWLAPVLALVTLGPILFTLLFYVLMRAPLGAAHAVLRKRRAHMASDLAERLPQGIALRRFGRLRVERRALAGHSAAVTKAAGKRALLAGLVRAAPDAASGLAVALVLWVAVLRGIDLPETAAALTALGLIVRPLRQLAGVSDKRQAWIVATGNLRRALNAPRMAATRSGRGAKKPNPKSPALELKAVRLHDGGELSTSIDPGETVAVIGAPGAGKSRLLMVAAGIDAPESGSARVFGMKPTEPAPGSVLYLGPAAPMLRGSLRRDATIGVDPMPSDPDILQAISRAGLDGLCARIGGLDGKVAEGRRNLTASETARLHVVRGLLSKARLALVDADEIGLDASMCTLLLEHFKANGTTCLLATSSRRVLDQLGSTLALPAPSVDIADNAA